MTFPTQRDLLKACREYHEHNQKMGYPTQHVLDFWKSIPEYREIAEELERLQVGKKSA